jgi:hypothetical protein
MKQGDKVRVTYEAEYVRLEAQRDVHVLKIGDVFMLAPAEGEIEVIHPEYPVGTVIIYETLRYIKVSPKEWLGVYVVENPHASRSQYHFTPMANEPEGCTTIPGAQVIQP